MKEAALFMHHFEKDLAEAKRIAEDTAKREDYRPSTPDVITW
jgi:hypothetical protein